MVVDISTLSVSKVETLPILNTPDVIHVGYNLIRDYIARDLVFSALNDNVSNYVIITDNNLAPLYLEKLTASIQTHLVSGQRLFARILPFGEKSKSRETKAAIEDYLLEQACTRDTCLIALGGGVIGDLVGYVASTFMRGVPFVQIPTTLLAMVDSSIGGKTAIDTPHGKNLIGTFWQPKRIYLDLSVLGTLPQREIANGMAEVIKTAAISSKEEFKKIETGKERIEAALSSISSSNKNQDLSEDSDLAFLAGIICASAKFKADVVTKDEREGGLRGLLNFGHSIGHAFEAVLSPKWLHGECVSVGLLLEAQLSFNLGHCSPQAVNRLANCLLLYNLPTVFDTKTRDKLDYDQVMQALKVDKKNKGAQKRIVLLSGIGKTLEQKASNVPDDTVEHVIKKCLSTAKGVVRSSPTKVRQKHQPLIPHPKLKLISTTVALDDIVFGLYNVVKNKFQCSIITSDDELMLDTSKQDEVLIYFTKKAGSTAILNEKDQWHEYVVLLDNNYDYLDGAERFITEVICGQEVRHIVPARKKSSTFITPTVFDYVSVLPVILDQWLEGANAVEFRADLLTAQKTDSEWISNTGTQLAHLRQKTNLPIIYTVRTSPQAGKFDLSLSSLYFDLIYWGHRWGCDYVDIEITTLLPGQLEHIMELNKSYPTTKLIASYHDPKRLHSWSSKHFKSIYDQAHQLFQKYNHAGVIKLVGYADSFWDNIELEQFRHKLDPENNRSLILINMGARGRLSRVANKFMSPATHPSLPSVAAPGQLSIAELIRLRNELLIA